MLQFRQRTVLGIEIVEDAVAIALVRGNGRRPTIKALFSASLPPSVDRESAKEVGSFVAEVLRDRGVSAGVCNVCVPRRSAIIKSLTLPLAEEGELPQMVRFQAERALPIPPASAQMDYAAHIAEDGASWEVTLAAARQEVAEWYSQLVEAAGLRLGAIDVSPFPLFVALQQYACRPIDESYLFVEVCARGALVGFVSRRRLIASRSLPVGTEDPGGLLLQLRRSAAAYAATEQEAERLILAGPSVTEALVAQIETELGMEAEVASHDDIVHAAQADEGPLPPEAFFSAVGVAIREVAPADHCFDLAASMFEVQERTAKTRRARRVAVAALCAVSILVAPWSVIQVRRHKIARFRQEFETLRPEGERLGRFRDGLKRYSPWANGRPHWLDALGVLSNESIMPYGIYMTSLSFSPASGARGEARPSPGAFECKMTGRARSDQYVYDLIDSLEASGAFQKTKSDYVRESRSREGRKGVDFSLTATYASSRGNTP